MPLLCCAADRTRGPVCDKQALYQLRQFNLAKLSKSSKERLAGVGCPQGGSRPMYRVVNSKENCMNIYDVGGILLE